MNAFQTCRNTSDVVPLYLPQQLYLKPLARLNISLQLPLYKTTGKSISNWEVMEQLRTLIKPEEFSALKVSKTSLEFIRFEAEIDDHTKLERVISKLDNKMIKLKQFNQSMKLRAAEARLEFPNRHAWDTFFREAKEMNEMKPGERPDTVHISNLPIKWFIPYHLSGEDDVKPSEKIFYRVFEKFGRIRYVDIPVCDPYRNKMKSHMSGLQTFSFDEEQFFEGYVQFKDYIGFTKAMDALRGMKLLYKGDDEYCAVTIKVDFDKTKHLSDASIRRREIVRDRLIQKEKEREEKEKEVKEEELRKQQAERQKEIDQKREKERRRHEREEKRKAKILAKLKVNGADEINDKIAKEERKLLKVQRKLEAIRLVEELFKRIQNKKEKYLSPFSKKQCGSENELTLLKNSSEHQVRTQKEKLHRAIEGRVVLKSILSECPRIRSYSTDSSSSDSSQSPQESKKRKDEKPLVEPNFTNTINSLYPDPSWYSFPNSLYPFHVYPNLRNHPSNYLPYFMRGRGVTRGNLAGPSRGSYSRRSRGGFNTRIRGRGNRGSLYPPELEEEYYKYFQKFLRESDHDDRTYRNYSRSRSKSRSRSRRRSHSRYSRSRSYSKSRRSYSRSKSRDRRSRSRSRSRQSHSKHSSRRSRTKKSYCRSRSRSVKSTEKKKSRSPSYKSIDSSKFISRLRIARSKSGSPPKETNESKKDRRSWSTSKSHTPPQKTE